MNNKFLYALLALMLQSAAIAAPDFAKQIEISADNLLSQKGNVATYSENVIITQGAIRIHADALEIDISAGKGKEVYSVSGSPVKYSQQLEDGKVVNAFASEMRYEPANRTLMLNGDAELAQSGSVVKASAIKYNVETQEINAVSDSSRRVTTIITPEEDKQP
ncbi:MAG: lipopolysaccharide transport periplasmic protein LptA [Gammaproteobacteria bacterium]|nr:lipopolysaccharide transport periplasmic protein LptA [Gammaproteobacteria bacterium]MBU1553274.1 lipopolysaccharide transport periplasmic protein LptA [Gammaproteobacteria bacterium]MBU2068931.1 lipopolysaccharide transport periplasmic protein LptA [Gammaproteobacteria bacterium]MBU2181437.1 lipopolysaccharide transport periplasmic protein LptA [Gammaproteobacteria bacterium]MBU2203816.1 lipopolysaccharide transport periplasmic protein LptA [Gammaproteobacteria bacterium]